MTLRNNNNGSSKMMQRLTGLLVFLASFSACADIYYGYGYVNQLGGLNLEWAGSKGSVYALVGARSGTTGVEEDDVRYTVGARRYFDGAWDQDTYFTGLMYGDFGEKHYERNGIAGELGYQWITPYIRATLSGGIVVMEELEERELKTEPQLLLGFTLNLRK